MKTLKFFSMLTILMVSVTISFAQEKKESFKVAGECGMCKSKIEKAAKDAGATYAEWSVDKKVLTVKYNNSSTNTARIEEAVAKVGYDTQNQKATDEAYNNLHACCKYERTTGSDSDCCAEGKCTKDGGCCKDGKCVKEGDCCSGTSCKMDCCVEGSDKKKDCCVDGKCTKEGHNGKDCCVDGSDKKMDCCVDGKCSKAGHKGKDCCKKSKSK